MYVSLGDIDNDGDLDALVACYQHLNKIWINDGNGNFSNSNQSLGGIETILMALGDVDSDGDLDVFVTSDENVEKVWLNDGSGNYTDSGQSIGTTDGHGYVALGDLDGDDDLDAFVTNIVHGNKIWLNNGSGFFTESGQYFGESSRQIVLGDLDSDADIDAITVHEELGNYIWINDGTGTFTSAGRILGTRDGLTISLGDLDGDSDLDALVGNESPSGSHNKVYFNETNVTGINKQRFIPRTLILKQNYPNPFNPLTKINYQISEPSFVTLKVYDLLGNEVALLVNDKLPEGVYEVEFNATDLPSGIYFYQMQAGKIINIKKMALIK
jgi:hypothetical protein